MIHAINSLSFLGKLKKRTAVWKIYYQIPFEHSLENEEMLIQWQLNESRPDRMLFHALKSQFHSYVNFFCSNKTNY